MASLFSITPASSTSTLEVSNNSAATTFTVTNMTDQTLNCRIDVVPDPPAVLEWFKVDRSQWNIPPRGVAPVAVTLKAPVTAEGKYTFRIDAVSLARPDEDVTPGPAIAFNLAKKAAPTPPPPRIKWWMILIAVLVLGIVGGVLYFVLRDTGMPNLAGKPVADAEKIVADKGLTITSRSYRKSQEPDDTVIGQTPAKGAPIPADKGVEIVISGTGLVSVPDLKGMQVAKARAALRAKGLEVGNEVADSGTSGPSGAVVNQNPRPGVQVVAGSKVILFVKQ